MYIHISATGNDLRQVSPRRAASPRHGGVPNLETLNLKVLRVQPPEDRGRSEEEHYYY